MKYLKVMFDKVSGASNNIEYKLNEINIAPNWNPNAKNAREMGGFNFSTEDKILRWLIRGDTLYDVTVPSDAEIVEVDNKKDSLGIFRTNKIIISNPRIITDEIALNLYNKSNLPDNAYYKSLAGCAIRGYKNTCLQIIKDKINNHNIDLVLSEFNDFVTPQTSSATAENGKEVYDEVIDYLNEIKSDLLISRFIDKEPYMKQITNDKVINLTGESGSGKSYFSNKYINNDEYIVIDTDIIFSDKQSDNKESIELRTVFKDMTKDYLITNFDDFYLKTLDYFKNINKTIVIDSAQYRNIKDFSILKGKVIVMRTSVDTCYRRTLNRWKEKNKYDEKEYKKFADKKAGMFEWYKNINTFLKEIDKI